MFFRLLSEVYLINGAKKSILQNIVNGKLFWIDNNIAESIQLCENNNPLSEEFYPYACELEKNGWGKVTNQPISVEKFRIKNANQKRLVFPKALNISFATLKLTGRCNLNCKNCGSVFCPTCIKESEIEKTMSLKLIEDVVRKLKFYGCRNILITGGEITLVPHLNKIYNLLIKYGFNVTLNTNGIYKLDNSFKSANILISLFSQKKLECVINNYEKFENVTLIKYFDASDCLFPSKWKILNRNIGVRQITKKSLVNTSVDKFYIRQNNNSCLDGKIVINSQGDVYPCLEAIKYGKMVGSIIKDDWGVIIQRLAEKFWNKTIDEHKICGNCEFRYACNSCAFDDVETKCCYDMGEGVWR